MTTTSETTCTVGGCDAPGHVRKCGCHLYGWTLCPVGKQLMTEVRDQQASTRTQRADGGAALRAARRAYRKHNPDK